MHHPLLLIVLILAVAYAVRIAPRIAGWTATRSWLRSEITRPATGIAIIVVPLAGWYWINPDNCIAMLNAVVTIIILACLLIAPTWLVLQVATRLPYRIRRRRIVAEIVRCLPARPDRGIEVAPLLHWLRYELGAREALIIMNRIGADPTVACHHGRLYRIPAPPAWRSRTTTINFSLQQPGRLGY